MRAILGFVGLGMVLLVVPLLRGEYVTLSVNPAQGESVTNSISVVANQAVDLVSGFGPGVVKLSFTNAEVETGVSYIFDYYKEYPVFVTPVAGPLVVSLRGSGYSWVTLKITPEQFDPQKALLVPPGGSGGRVQMEKSTNLTDWVEATNGLYAAQLDASFLRVRLDGVQAATTTPVTPELREASQIITLSGGGQSVTAGPHQILEVVAIPYVSGGVHVWMQKDGVQTSLTGTGNPSHSELWYATPVRGPATIGGGAPNDYVSIRISAEAYPPDKTMILLPGTNSYNVTLEGSTNLVDWATATNGVYTEPSAMFFRINSQRVN